VKHFFSVADENLIAAISDPVELGKRTDKLQPFLDHAAEEKAREMEIGLLGKYQESRGWTNSRKMQRVAVGIPAPVLGMMQQIDPEFMKSKEKFFRWLEQHPEWDARGRVS
jgi:hypothetical protein